MARTTQVKITAKMGAAVATVLLVLATPITLAQTSAAPIGAAPLAPTTSPAVARGVYFVPGPADGLAVATGVVDNPPPTRGLQGFIGAKVGPVLPMYAVNPADVAAGHGLAKASIIGSDTGRTRHAYLIHNEGRGIGKVEVMTEGGRSRLLSINVSPESDNIMRALTRLAEMPEVKAGSFEVRYLNAGGINGSGPTTLLWLKADQGDKDYVFTPGTNFPPLEWNKIYTIEEFLKVAQPLAQRVMDRAAEFANQPVPAARPNPNDSVLGRGRLGMYAAQRSLGNATTNNHGGYIELARADFERAVADFQKAFTYFDQHPESAALPAEISPASERALTRILEKEFPKPNNQNNLVQTLEGMKTMADALKKAPGGTLDGNRDKIIVNLERSFDNLTTAFDFLAKGNIPKAATRPDAP